MLLEQRLSEFNEQIESQRTKQAKIQEELEERRKALARLECRYQRIEAELAQSKQAREQIIVEEFAKYSQQLEEREVACDLLKEQQLLDEAKLAEDGKIITVYQQNQDIPAIKEALEAKYQEALQRKKQRESLGEKLTPMIVVAQEVQETMVLCPLRVDAANECVYDREKKDSLIANLAAWVATQYLQKNLNVEVKADSFCGFLRLRTPKIPDFRFEGNPQGYAAANIEVKVLYLDTPSTSCLDADKVGASSAVSAKVSTKKSAAPADAAAVETDLEKKKGKMYTVTEALPLLGYAERSAVTQSIRRGRLKAEKCPGRSPTGFQYRISQQSIDECLSRQKKRGPDQKSLTTTGKKKLNLNRSHSGKPEAPVLSGPGYMGTSEASRYFANIVKEYGIVFKESTIVAGKAVRGFCDHYLDNSGNLRLPCVQDPKNNALRIQKKDLDHFIDEVYRKQLILNAIQKGKTNEEIGQQFKVPSTTVGALRAHLTRGTYTNGNGAAKNDHSAPPDNAPPGDKESKSGKGTESE